MARCVESFTAGWALARDGRDLLLKERENTPLYSCVNGDPALVTAQAVIESAQAGDGRCKAIVSRAFTFLAVGISNVIHLLAPELVVLGGGVTKAGDLMVQPVMGALSAHLIPALVGTPISLSTCGDDVTLLGAAALAEQELK